MAYRTEISIDTQKNQFHDITSQLNQVVGNSDADMGICHLFVLHTSCVLVINEHEPRLQQDLREWLDTVLPEERQYHHSDGNAHAHLKNIFLGSEHTVPFSDGQLQLGAWQGIAVYDPDGPRTRQLLVTVLD